MNERDQVRDSLKCDQTLVGDVESILRLVWPRWPEQQLRLCADEIAAFPYPGVMLRHEAMFARMQTPASRAATQRAVNPDSAAMGRAAVEAARRAGSSESDCVACGARPATIRVRVHPLLGEVWICDAHLDTAPAAR